MRVGREEPPGLMKVSESALARLEEVA